jgi:hypothetical protein
VCQLLRFHECLRKRQKEIKRSDDEEGDMAGGQNKYRKKVLNLWMENNVIRLK